MLNPNDYGLKTNPFQIVATETDEHVHLWAGMPKVRRNIDDIVRTVLPNYSGSSEFVIIHGEYGGGKTYALRYFQREIKKQKYGHIFFVSKTKMSGKISFTRVFNSIMEESGDEFFRALTGKIKHAINSEVHAINNGDAPENWSDLEEQIITNKVALSNRPMVRDLLAQNHPQAKDDYEAATKLASLFSVMTTSIGEQHAPYPAVYLFIDEMEEVFEGKPTETLDFFNALRELINRVQERFALICTFSSGGANLEAQIPIAIQSRETRPMVELPPLSNEEAKVFILDLLAQKRIDENHPKNSFFPFSEGAIDSLLEREQDPYPRKIIMGMRHIFNRAIQNEKIQPGEEISKEMAEEILIDMGF